MDGRLAFDQTSRWPFCMTRGSDLKEDLGNGFPGNEIPGQKPRIIAIALPEHELWRFVPGGHLGIWSKMCGYNF